MKRFLKIFVLLVVALLLLASGVNATLDRLASAPAQNTFTWYDDHGVTVVAYSGEQALAQKLPRPIHAVAPLFFHRT